MWSISEPNQRLIFAVVGDESAHRRTDTHSHALSQQSYLNAHILTATATQSFILAFNHCFEAMEVTV